jgi:hypothetical protein
LVRLLSFVTHPPSRTVRPPHAPPHQGPTGRLKCKRRGQTREEDAASVYGYTGKLLRKRGQTPAVSGTSGQAREEDAASVYGYTGTLRAIEQTELMGDTWPCQGTRMRRVCVAGTTVHGELIVRGRGVGPRAVARGTCTGIPYTCTP